MMKQTCVILLGLLLIGSKSGADQMDAKSLINFLNFQATLIHDAEIKFLWYEKSLIPPDDIEKIQQQVLVLQTQELREVHNASNPDARRKAIMKNIEEYKKYGNFWYAEQHYFFKEINLVFRVRSDSTTRRPQLDYRMELIDRFENYPTLSFKRYFNGGSQVFIVNTNKGIRILLPNHFSNDRLISGISKWHDNNSMLITFPFQLPPIFIDGTQVQMEISEFAGDIVYVITHFPLEKVMAKVYVSVTKLPKVIREELYHQSESPNANEDGYWLQSVAEYSHFVHVETLGIFVPQVYQEKEYRTDGFLRRITKVTIEEMTFNKGFPSNFFDLNLEELE